MIHPIVKPTSDALRLAYAAYNLKSQIEEGHDDVATPVKENAAIYMVGECADMAQDRARAGR